MNTASSLFLAGLILAFVVVDALFFGWEMSRFVALRFIALLDWVAFWR